jgi:ABC-type dipeptide/oligopeptide/nickel transport system permease component
LVNRIYIYVARRTLESFATVLAVLTLNFLLIHTAPGDPALVMAGEFASPESLEATRVRWGLDKPLYVQYLTYLSGVFQGDLGFSLDFNQPVLKVIVARIPNSLALVLPVMVIGLAAGLILGAVAARHYGTRLDSVLQILGVLMYATPTFWFGLVLLEIFAIRLDLFPLLGGGLVGDPISILHHLALPLISLILVWTAPLFMRLTRSSLLSVLKEDYITTSRAVGFPESVIFYRHALRNALLPSITVLGVMAGNIFMGAVLVETVFSWPGLGLLLFEAIQARDYPLLMGMFTIIGISVSIAVLVTDLVYALLDPRITYR